MWTLVAFGLDYILFPALAGFMIVAPFLAIGLYDDFTSLVSDTKQLISSRGGEVVREEAWGKRKLAYPIQKLTEGRYSFLFLQMEPKAANLISEVEMRLGQIA